MKWSTYFVCWLVPRCPPAYTSEADQRSHKILLQDHTNQSLSSSTVSQLSLSLDTQTFPESIELFADETSDSYTLNTSTRSNRTHRRADKTLWRYWSVTRKLHDIPWRELATAKILRTWSKSVVNLCIVKCRYMQRYLCVTGCSLLPASSTSRKNDDVRVRQHIATSYSAGRRRTRASRAQVPGGAAPRALSLLISLPVAISRHSLCHRAER